MTLAKDIAARWQEAARAPLPETIARVASLHLLDTIGVGLAAAGSSNGRPYLDFARQGGLKGPAAVFGHAPGATPAEAALINGGLIHSLEYDDTHTGSVVHGSAVLAAVALAAGGSDGGAVLGAYVRGWELLIRIGLAAPGGFQARGFQLTSVGGTLAAAMVASELGGLTQAQAVSATGIGLSQASGVFEFLDNGASVKSLHPGWAAHAGITAAALARAGLTGPETAFEGRFGLFRAFAGDDAAASRLQTLIGDFGTVWHLADAAFKFHPCCHYLHPFIEAAGLLAAQGVRAEAIEHVLCRVPAGAAGIICEPWPLKQVPRTGHAARWSLPAVVAARLVEGKVDLETFERVLSPPVLALAARSEWEPLGRDRFPERFEAEIRVRLRDGSVQEVRVEDADGNRSRPAAPQRVREKFRANAARSLPPGQAARLEASIDSIADAGGLGRLMQALGAGA